MNPALDSIQKKMNSGASFDIAKKLLQYGNMHFRFETCLVNNNSGKKLLAYRDIVCNQWNLRDLENIPVPLGHKGQIRVKVLRMPCIANNPAT